MSKQKEGGVYSTAYGADRHVVVCSTALRASTMIDFLNEFYADPKMEVSCNEIFDLLALFVRNLSGITNVVQAFGNILENRNRCFLDGN